MNPFERVVTAALFAGAILAALAPRASAADHGDAPNVAGDQGGDLGDTFVFLNPNDNTRVVIAVTLRGFLVPGEAVNFGVFDPATTYRFDIENTGDARADQTIDVSFSPKGATAAEPQTATIVTSGRPKRSFTAPTTVSTLAPTPNTPTVTVDATTGISFFAGPVDDPFFFDIPAFSRLRLRCGPAIPTRPSSPADATRSQASTLSRSC